jgi:ABC-type branched-subunit amino acid transport system substrate-binding protein
MNKIINFLYKKITKDKITLFIIFTIIIILFITFISYIVIRIIKRIKRKNIYVGCLYSEFGLLQEASIDNYKILIESFNYAIKENNCNIKIIPIYKNLKDNLSEFPKWVEECVKKYNIKYFFGCWRSSERESIKSILKKYNLKLFYPLQYEGSEALKNIYYFGSCPNQQIIPGLKYFFDTFYYYNDIYIIGSDYSYPQISIIMIKNYIEKFHKDKKIIFSKLYSLEETDFSEFIEILFKKSPNGAIIINLINGKSYYSYSKQIYEYYNKVFGNINESIFNSQIKVINYLKNPSLEINIKLNQRYPSITTSIVENDLIKNDIKYIYGNYFAFNFSNEVIINPIYHLTEGYENADKDLKFLKNFIKKQNKPIGDAQYSTFLSALFFIKTLKIILDKKENIYDPDIYDKYKKITFNSVTGNHSFLENNHITKNFFVLQSNTDGIFNIKYQSFINIEPMPFIFLADKIFDTDSNKQNIYLSNRIYN